MVVEGMRRIFVYGLILACLISCAGVIGAWSLLQGVQDSIAGGQKGDLELSMTLDKTIILAGEDVDFVFVLKNKGDKNVTFWMGPPFFDACLYDLDDTLVARWTEGRAFATYIENFTLEPGKNFSKTVQWNLSSFNHETGGFVSVKPGQYRVSGVWLGEPCIETSKVGITVKGTGGIEGTVTDSDGNPLVGMSVGIVSGTTFFPEIAVETTEEGYYQIGSVPPGTFEVAVHDRQGNRIVLGSVTVKSVETSTLDFIIEPVPSDVTKFKAVVNGMWSIDVFVCVNISDGLTEKEAELIVGTTFILVKGDYVMHRLVTLTFDNTEIEAHYIWGVDEDDMGHVFDVTVDLATLEITVSHCF